MGPAASAPNTAPSREVADVSDFSRRVRGYVSFPWSVLGFWVVVLVVTSGGRFHVVGNSDVSGAQANAAPVEWPGNPSPDSSTAAASGAVSRVAITGQRPVSVVWSGGSLRVESGELAGASVSPAPGSAAPTAPTSLPLRLTLANGAVLASLEPKDDGKYLMRGSDGAIVYRLKFEDGEWHLADSAEALLFRGKYTSEKFEIYDAHDAPLLKGKIKDGFVIRTPAGEVLSRATLSLSGSLADQFSVLSALSVPLDLRYRLLFAAVALSHSGAR